MHEAFGETLCHEFCASRFFFADGVEKPAHTNVFGFVSRPGRQASGYPVYAPRVVACAFFRRGLFWGKSSQFMKFNFLFF